MRRRMMMAKAKDDFFELDVFEVKYTSEVSVGSTTAITVNASTPVNISGKIYYGARDSSVVTQEAVDQVIMLDNNGNELCVFTLTNSKAIERGRASYASYNYPVKIEEAISYTFHIVAISVNGKRSKPLTITITGHE